MEESSTPVRQLRGSTLKRRAESDEQVSDKKRPPAEQASRSTGKPVNDEESEEETPFSRAILEAHIDRLKKRIEELGEREMCDDEREEDRMIRIEDSLTDALDVCERRLAKIWGDDKEENEKVKLVIHFPNCPSLDPYVQEFATDRFFGNRQKGLTMEIPELIEIMKKIRALDPKANLPAEKDRDEIERLHATVNHEIVKAIRPLRYGKVMENTKKKAGIDQKAEQEMVNFIRNRAYGEEENAPMEEQRQRFFKELQTVEEEDQTSNVIALNEEEDEGKEGDEDEMDDKEEEDGSQLDDDADDDSDVEILEDESVSERASTIVLSDFELALQELETATQEESKKVNEDKEMAIQFDYEVQPKDDADNDDDDGIQVLKTVKKPYKMNNTRAQQIQQWINSIENFEDNEIPPLKPQLDEPQPEIPVPPEYEQMEDDGIECLEDDYEWDSASHQGLEFWQELKAQGIRPREEPVNVLEQQKQQQQQRNDVTQIE